MRLGVTRLFCCLWTVGLSLPAMASTYGGNCVSYVRAVTGMDISGNAGAWWGNAAGRYNRGDEPAPGSVLVFKPSGAMWLGHVAVVSQVVNKREILVDQANWVPGRVVKDMAVYDVSAANNWSAVRVADYRSTNWGRINPTFGFIYPERPARGSAEVIEADYRPSEQARSAPATHLTVNARERTPQDQRDERPARDRVAFRSARQDEALRNRHDTQPREADAGHDRATAAHARSHQAHETKLAALHDRKADIRRHAERVATAERTKLRDRHETGEKKLAALHERKTDTRRHIERVASADRKRLHKPHEVKIAAQRESIDRSRHQKPVHVAEASRSRSTEAHAHHAEHRLAKAEHPAARRRHLAAGQHPQRIPEQIADVGAGVD